ncbi:hypothetical protein [Maridesulfovibrio zosterae]|uniref:hypothetical protein n=1 Tax=Maridesulfovibrio zosterae TaxID=82171 RepID=UPI0004009BC9|nr:hypothetical protein [Maridesulfovibrio zosterae]
MFIDESFCGCGGDVKLNNRKASRVLFFDILFAEEAVILIGLGIKSLAEKHRLPEFLIKQHMKRNLFFVPPSENLYFLFTVPELDADMHITIPPCHWEFVGDAKGKYFPDSV